MHSLRTELPFALALSMLVLAGCPPAQECQTAAQCDDGDACTADVCAENECLHTVLAVDDGNACTVDGCDPTTGVSHAALDPDDGDACTTDSCDPATGVVRSAVDPNDGDACTVDSCDPSTGVSHAAVDPDDGDACTTDSCDPATGVTHSAVDPDDGNVCTTDSCDPATGVAHVAVDPEDGDACTTDSCDPVTGVAHAAVDPDDGDACTTDSCHPATGVFHTAVNPDDGNACTTDSCNPSTGVSSEPVDARDGVACTVDTCDTATGSVTHSPQDAYCDDGVACTVDSCSVENGCANLPEDSLCAAGQTCSPTAGCRFTSHPIISEFVAAGLEYIELHNPTAFPRSLNGLLFQNGGGQTASIRHSSTPGDPSTVVELAPGAYVYGFRNPSNPASIPPTAAFVYGEPGTDFRLTDSGDVLRLADSIGVLDEVDFRALVTDPQQPLAPGDFPAPSGHSTQLDPGSLTAEANDDGSNWCSGLTLAFTFGFPNVSCGAVQINEVLYDFAHPNLGGADEGRVFVELTGNPGARLQGIRLQGVRGDGVAQAPEVTIGVTPGITSVLRMPLDGVFVIADAATDNGPSHVPNADLTLAAGDPQDGNGGGDGLWLQAADGSLLDALAYGPVTAPVGEGAPVKDLDPDQVALSLARDVSSSDSQNNAADFRFDPTPTPGARNLSQVVQVLSVLPSNGLATANTQVTVTALNVGEFLDADDQPQADNEVNASFAGVATSDSDGPGDGCEVVDIADEGRGAATLTCTAPPRPEGTPVRGDLVLANPALLGGQQRTLADAWTYQLPNNEEDSGAELDSCNLQFPSSLSVTTGQPTSTLFGRAFELGVTEPAGPAPALQAEVGYGPGGSNPLTHTGWRFFPASFNVQVGNSDEYAGSFTAPAPGSYAFAYRFTQDGGLHWTYCDLNGAGSDSGVTFEYTNLGTMTVNP